MVSHDGPFFTGTLQKLILTRDESPAFNLLQLVLNGQNITTVQGDRSLEHNGNMQLHGRISVGTRSLAEANVSLHPRADLTIYYTYYASSDP